MARAGGDGDTGQCLVIGRLDVARSGRTAISVQRYDIFVRRPDGVEGDHVTVFVRQIAILFAAEIGHETIVVPRPTGKCIANSGIGARLNRPDRVLFVIRNSVACRGAGGAGGAAVGVILDRVRVRRPLGFERDVAAAHRKLFVRLIGRRAVAPAAEGVALAGRRGKNRHVRTGGIHATVKWRVHTAVRVVGDDVVLVLGLGNINLDVPRDLDVVIPVVLRTEQHTIGIHADGAITGGAEFQLFAILLLLRSGRGNVT